MLEIQRKPGKDMVEGQQKSVNYLGDSSLVLLVLL